MLGISFACIDYASRGIHPPPHTHPRASKILTLFEGCLEVGFVTYNPSHYQVLTKGCCACIPINLVHFQRNAGHGNVLLLLPCAVKTQVSLLLQMLCLSLLQRFHVTLLQRLSNWTRMLSITCNQYSRRGVENDGTRNTIIVRPYVCYVLVLLSKCVCELELYCVRLS